MVSTYKERHTYQILAKLFRLCVKWDFDNKTLICRDLF